MSKEEESNIVSLTGDDGNEIKCEVFDIIEFENKTYALLIPQDEIGEDDESQEKLIVLEYVEEGDDCYFQNIEDDEEFDRVCEFVDTLEYDDDEE
ncbi:MAG: DUF1292 domain-containing protein [bacterium]|nr:DUF1292 domain-containing protein [bacterium]